MRFWLKDGDFGKWTEVVRHCPTTLTSAGVITSGLPVIQTQFGGDYNVNPSTLEKTKSDPQVQAPATTEGNHDDPTERSRRDLCGISVSKASAAGPRQRDGVRGGGRGRPNSAAAWQSHL